MKLRATLSLLLSLSCLTGCNRALTASEARAALDEASLESQASALTANTVELNTEFTIGSAVEAAAAELRTFVQSQVPCADVTVAGGVLRIVYGARGGCLFRGRSFTGEHTVSIMRNDATDVLVHHEWNDLSEGTISVTGEAEVTWSLNNRSRRVVHDLTWTRLRDERVGEGSGDRTQAALGGGIAEGLMIDGQREWRGQSGEWALDIDAVEVRWRDPVPQAGTYALDTPFDKTATLSFDRLDGDTITVTVASGRKSFAFDVNSVGAIVAR